MERFIINGPPGTGKSSYCARQIKAAVLKYGARGVLVTSLTKAAAQEIASRDTGIDPDMVGTLHSFCYGTLTDSKVFTHKHVEGFNKASKFFSLSDSYVRNGKVVTDGDRILTKIEVKRAKCVPVDQWTVQEKHFHRLFGEWKATHGLVDFTDMIENALEDVPIAPGSPAVIVVDEAQDVNTLEWKVINRWAMHVDTLIIAGDPFQSLFDWRGSDVSIFLDEEPFAVLSQSWRVPRKVHEFACGLLKKSGHKVPEYHARDSEGLVKRIPATWKSPEPLLRMIDEHIEDERSIMILATCDYMLQPLCKMFREKGYPYYNPYSKGRWSPLRNYSRFSETISTAERLAAYMSPTYRSDKFWTIKDFKLWAPLLNVKTVFKRGAKKAISELDADKEYVSREDVANTIKRFILPEAIPKLARLDPVWFRANCVPSKASALEYPLAVLKRFGHNALLDTPKIIVGTIHSVKGGEAESVVVFPDLSREGADQLRRVGWTGRDAIMRVFYVAATRAREELYIASPVNLWSSFSM